MTQTPEQTVRMDKWLWAARFFKTRALAAEALGKGRVEVHGVVVKASRDVRVGDRITLRVHQDTFVIDVLAVSSQRGPAPVAQQLYRETPESLSARQAAQERRRQGVEPAAAQPAGRPSKRDRRQLETVAWKRWSVSLDDS